MAYRILHIIIFVFLFTGIFAQKFEIYQGDTINFVDAAGKKQGLWIIFFENGKPKQEITYKNGMANGFARFYYENGKVSEEGIWKMNKWTGDYKYYNEKGQILYDWKYNAHGKREGVQKYYHENGNLQIEGTWKNGKEEGIIKEFYEDGSLKSEKSFDEGKFDETKAKTYDKKEVKPENKKVSTDIKKETSPKEEPKEKPNTDTVKTKKKTDLKNIKQFDGNGFHKTFNSDRQILREGEFKKGHLFEGKHYIYNSEGKLVVIKIYKNGVVVGKQKP